MAEERVAKIGGEIYKALSVGKKNIKLLEKYSLKEMFDPRHYYLSQIIINPKLSASFSQWFLQKIQIFTGTRKKCLVLDLDNTLWGGVLGEKGVEGIALGNTYPGNCFVDFQEIVANLKK